ncbi:hypothetical protein CONCODRAFT_86436 [Conidiobolus coronatus NRRL 28638]|uniref:Uncharacterized protein n=1 Tax=Conidiobolus coronatus (strain ATCC 28846 / CBS 209.66 / NRRL 28638) TaxID=796925 RepID=A0A137P0V7_CONC2|nr:hypothetical protein CONCODRAFT_86436 [Conidiobolus coronatus NRRL 28638]|eukprot:KXN68489.1 hypothetical protein CONCODRAFT_86436 [Conidiobolus coronatus NRRL 28638]
MDERQSKRTSYQFAQPMVVKPEVSTNGQSPLSFKFDTSNGNGSGLFNTSKNTKFATFTSSAKKPAKANNFNQPNLSLFGSHVSLNEAKVSIPPNPTLTFGSINSPNSKNLSNNKGLNFGSTSNGVSKPSLSNSVNKNNIPSLQNGIAKNSNNLFNFGSSQAESVQLSSSSNTAYTFGSYKNPSVKDTSSNIDYVFRNQQSSNIKPSNGAVAFGTTQNQTTSAPILLNPFSTSAPSASFQLSSLPTKPDFPKEPELENGIKTYFRSGDHTYQVSHNISHKATDITPSNFNLPALTRPPHFSNPFALLPKITKEPRSPLNKQLSKDENSSQQKLINTPPSLPPLNLEPQHVPLPNTDEEDDFIFYSDRIRTNMLRLNVFDECSTTEFSSNTAINLVKILYLTKLKATMEQRYTDWYSTIEEESNQSGQFSQKSTKDLASIASTS